MNLVDYMSQAEDHSSVLVLIKNINEKYHSKTFNKFFDRIAALDSIYINIPPQQQVITNQLNRVVNIRYVKHHSTEKNCWGNFQVHRRVLGLVSFGFKTDDNDLEENILIKHEKMQEQFAETLLDTRLFLIGGCPDSPLATDLDKSFTNDENVPIKTNNCQQQNNVQIRQSHVIKYASIENCVDLEEQMKEFLRSLFWVLEGKRLDRSHERSDNLLILTAPFEKADAINFDLENKLHRKKCLGRFKKQLGDLCLLAGVPGEASMHFQTALEILKQCSDWLWIAAAQEGIAISSYLMLKPKSLPLTPFPRSFIFSKPTLASMHNQTTDNLLTIQDKIIRVSPKDLHEEILVSYNEAVVNYSKIKEAAFIEVEASLKACRILTIYQRNLLAADFLQNIIRINLNISEREKIQHFSMLSMLYGGIKMSRKSAFYSRIATLVSAIVAKDDNNWILCYRLLLQTFPGFKLSLDCRHSDYITVNNGWRAIQLRVLHELVYTARHMEDTNVCIRHLLLLLHTMSDNLNSNEKSELFSVLRSYMSKCQPTLHSIALPDGTILPPVSFFKYPTLRAIRLVQMLPEQRPIKYGIETKSENLFIYSPLAKPDKIFDSNIYWMVGVQCQVSFQFYNQLSFELEINNLSVVVEGDVTNTSISFVIPPMSPSENICVSITPNSVGTVIITGYTIDVMGIKSHCRLREMQLNVGVQGSNLVAIVSPSLPLVQLACSLKSSDRYTTTEDGDFVTSSASIHAFAGQKIEFNLSITNIGNIIIDYLEAVLILPSKLKFLNKCLTWDHTKISSNLPLDPTLTLQLPITFYWEPEKHFTKKKDLNLSQQVDEVQIMIRYGHSLSKQYLRQSSLLLLIELQPSLHLLRAEMHPSNMLDKCYLSLLMLNKLSENVDLMNYESKDIIYSFAPFSKAWICVFFPSFNNDLNEPDKFEAICKHFEKNFKISWIKENSSIDGFKNKLSSGSISLQPLKNLLTQQFLFHNLNLIWEVKINTKTAYPYSRLLVQEMPISIVVQLTNQTQFQLQDVSFIILLSGDVDSDLEMESKNCVVVNPATSHSFWVGSNSINSQMLNSKDNLTLSSILFSTIEISYSLTISCSFFFHDLNNCKKTIAWQHIVFLDVKPTQN